MTTPDVVDLYAQQVKTNEQIKSIEKLLETYIDENKELIKGMNRAKGAIWAGWMLGGVFLSLLGIVGNYVVNDIKQRVSKLEDNVYTPQKPITK